jgi:hypothetical protein
VYTFTADAPDNLPVGGHTFVAVGHDTAMRPSQQQKQRMVMVSTALPASNSTTGGAGGV